MNNAQNEPCQSSQRSKVERLEALCLEQTSLLHSPHGPKGFNDLGLEWLDQEVHWPATIKRRIHRYMHSHNLYEVTDAHDVTFTNLLRLFIAAANFPDTQQTVETISSRCSAFIYSAAQQWRFQGLLIIDERNKIVKSSTFERLWNLAVEYATAERRSRKRARGIDQVDHILPSRPSRSSDSSDSKVGCPQKRSLESNDAKLLSLKKIRIKNSISENNDAEECIVVSTPAYGKNMEAQTQGTMSSDLLPLGLSNQTVELRDPTQLERSGYITSAQMSTTPPPAPPITADASTSASIASSDMKGHYPHSPSSQAGIKSSTLKPLDFPLEGLLEHQRGENLSKASFDTVRISATEQVPYSSSSFGMNLNKQPVKSLLDNEQPKNVFHVWSRRFSVSQSTGATNVDETKDSSVPDHQYVASLTQSTPFLESIIASPESCTTRNSCPGGATPRALSNLNPTSQHSINPLSTSFPTTLATLKPAHTTQRAGGPTPTNNSTVPLKLSPPVSHFSFSRGQSGSQSWRQDSVVESAGEHTRYDFMNDPRNISVSKRKRSKPRYVLVDPPSKSYGVGSEFRRFNGSLPTSPQSSTDQHSSTSPLSNSISALSRGSNDLKDVVSSIPSPPKKAINLPFSTLRRDQASVSKPHQASEFDENSRPRLSVPGCVSNIPAVTFTTCNKIISQLYSPEFYQVISAVEQTARIVTGTSRNARLWPIDIILNQDLPNFYKWYTRRWDLVRKSPSRTLRFTFLDVPWESENMIVLPADNVDRFRVLKQCTWDWFWTANSSKKRLTSDRKWWFRIRIEPVDQSDELRIVGFAQRNIISKSPFVSSGSGNPPRSHLTTLPPMTISDSQSSLAISAPPHSAEVICHKACHTGETRMSSFGEFQQAYGDQSSMADKPIERPCEPSHNSNSTYIPASVPSISTSYPKPNMGVSPVSVVLPDLQHPQLQRPVRAPTSQPQPDPDPAPPPPPSPDPPTPAPDPPRPDPNPNSTKPEITIRLQLYPCGPFSLPYPKSFLDPEYTTPYFFAWFASQTSYTSHTLSSSGAPPRGGPRRLRFTFKDANPRKDGRLQCKDLEIGDEERFRLVGDTVEQLFSRTWRYFPGAKEWVVLVTALSDPHGLGRDDEKS